MAAATVAGTASSSLGAEEESVKPVRIGVVGVGGRGRWHVKNLLSYQENVIIPAICDYQKDRLAMAIDSVKQLKGYTPEGYSKDDHDYLNMLKRREIYRHISNCADRMADAANTLHDIIVKIS